MTRRDATPAPTTPSARVSSATTPPPARSAPPTTPTASISWARTSSSERPRRPPPRLTRARRALARARPGWSAAAARRASRLPRRRHRKRRHRVHPAEQPRTLPRLFTRHRELARREPAPERERREKTRDARRETRRRLRAPNRLHRGRGSRGEGRLARPPNALRADRGARPSRPRKLVHRARAVVRGDGVRGEDRHRHLARWRRRPVLAFAAEMCFAVSVW